MRTTIVADDGMSPALTTVYAGFDDNDDTDEEEIVTVSVRSWVTLISTVFAGSVDITVSVDTTNVTVGAVTVATWSTVRITVVAASWGVDVAAEPPSTATTE